MRKGWQRALAGSSTLTYGHYGKTSTRGCLLDNVNSIVSQTPNSDLPTLGDIVLSATMIPISMHIPLSRNPHAALLLPWPSIPLLQYLNLMGPPSHSQGIPMPLSYSHGPLSHCCNTSVSWVLHPTLKESPCRSPTLMALYLIAAIPQSHGSSIPLSRNPHAALLLSWPSISLLQYLSLMGPPSHSQGIPMPLSYSHGPLSHCCNTSVSWVLHPTLKESPCRSPTLMALYPTAAIPQSHGSSIPLSRNPHAALLLSWPSIPLLQYLSLMGPPSHSQGIPMPLSYSHGPLSHCCNTSVSWVLHPTLKESPCRSPTLMALYPIAAIPQSHGSSIPLSRNPHAALLLSWPSISLLQYLSLMGPPSHSQGIPMPLSYSHGPLSHCCNTSVSWVLHPTLKESPCRSPTLMALYLIAAIPQSHGSSIPLSRNPHAALLLSWPSIPLLQYLSLMGPPSHSQGIPMPLSYSHGPLSHCCNTSVSWVLHPTPKESPCRSPTLMALYPITAIPRSHGSSVPLSGYPTFKGPLSHS